MQGMIIFATGLYNRIGSKSGIVLQMCGSLFYKPQLGQGVLLYCSDNTRGNPGDPEGSLAVGIDEGYGDGHSAHAIACNISLCNTTWPPL